MEPLYKILVLTNLYPGGRIAMRGSFVQNQVASLERLGHSVRVVAIDGVRTRWDYLGSLRRLRRALAEERFDLVHAHYGLTGFIGATQRRVPLVLTHLGSDLLWKRQRGLSRLAGRLADCNIVMTRQMAGILDRPNACVLPNGTDLEIFHPEPPGDARRRLGWPADEFLVLFPSNPGRPVKNFHLAEEACREAQRLAPHPIRLVVFHNRPQEEFNLALNAADVCLLTSHWEGSPNAVRESMAVGLPVVSVAVGDAPEMLAGVEHCRICPRDSVALGAALTELAERRSNAGDFLRHSGRSAVEPFSVSAVARKLTVIYRLVLAGERRGDRIQREIDALAL